MGAYIERETSPITLEEWSAYIEGDNELTLSEVGSVINPITKQKMTFKSKGRAVFGDLSEFTYSGGRIYGEGANIEVLLKKMFAIAAALSAYVFDDDGERVDMP